MEISNFGDSRENCCKTARRHLDVDENNKSDLFLHTALPEHS